MHHYTEPTSQTFDAIILGGGPAGAQCSLWLKMLGYAPVILEKSGSLGGLQRINPYKNHWIVCLPDYTGMEVAQAIQDNIARQQVSFVTDVQSASIISGADGFSVSGLSSSGNFSLRAPKLVIATGVAHKTGGFQPSERIIVGSGQVIEQRDFSGRKVAILGGGDTAAENWHFIRRKSAASVKIYARTLRARRQLLGGIPPEDIVRGPFHADESVMTVNGEEFDIFCVMYGWEPVNPLPETLRLERDGNGFFRVDHDCRTSHADIFAIGECAQRWHPCVTTAMADGVIAAKAIQRDLG